MAQQAQFPNTRFPFGELLGKDEGDVALLEEAVTSFEVSKDLPQSSL